MLVFVVLGKYLLMHHFVCYELGLWFRLLLLLLWVNTEREINESKAMVSFSAVVVVVVGEFGKGN